MESNVFGTPITDETLQRMPEYAGKTTARRDRAVVARNTKNADLKEQNANKYVDDLKKQFGDSESTLCLIYNATGDTINFVRSQDWFGHIGPKPYPFEIAN